MFQLPSNSRCSHPSSPAFLTKVAVISGTGIRVQTIAIAAYQWGLSPNQLVEEYELTEAQVISVCFLVDTDD